MRKKEEKTKMVSRDTLRAVLMELRTATPTSIRLRTEPKMNVKSRIDGAPNPFLNNLVRFSRAVAWIGVSYERMVNNARSKMGEDRDFVAASHSWALPIPGTCFYTHAQTGELYIGFNLRASKEGEYRTIGDDRLVAQSELDQYLPPKKSAAERQGLTRSTEIQWRTVKFSNVVTMKLNGTTYIVMP
jgi:hypothetical protein